MEIMDDEIIRTVEESSNKSLSEQLKEHWATMTNEEIRKEMDEVEMHMYGIDADEPDALKRLNRIRRKEKINDLWAKTRRIFMLGSIPVSLIVLAISPNIAIRLIFSLIGLAAYIMILHEENL